MQTVPATLGFLEEGCSKNTVGSRAQAVLLKMLFVLKVAAMAAFGLPPGSEVKGHQNTDTVEYSTVSHKPR